MRKPPLYSGSRQLDSQTGSAGLDLPAEPLVEPLHAQPINRLSRLRKHLSLNNVLFLWSVVGLLA